MNREDLSSSRAVDDAAAGAAASIVSRRYHGDARTRRLAVLYAAGFLLVATIRVLHEAVGSSRVGGHPSQLQVVFRQSLNGAPNSYLLRCRLGDAIATQTVVEEGRKGETPGGSHEEETSTVVSPENVRSEKESSRDDKPFNRVEGSKSQRLRASHHAPPLVRSGSHARSRLAQSAHVKEMGSERGQKI
jgi:hypothetical protein